MLWNEEIKQASKLSEIMYTWHLKQEVTTQDLLQKRYLISPFTKYHLSISRAENSTKVKLLHVID